MAASARRFGMEIECGHPRGNDGVGNLLDHAYEVDYDGSGCEIRVGPLQGDEGFAELTRVMDTVRNTGGYVTRADGAHVHLEALDYIGQKAMQARLVRSWLNVEAAIEKIIAPYRRGNYGACPKVFRKGDGTVKRAMRASGYGRGNLNLNNLRYIENAGKSNRFYTEEGTRYCRGCDEPANWCCCDRDYETPPTIEIRWHEGTLTPEHAIAWITMGQRLLDVVADGGATIKTCLRPSTLVKRLELPSEIGEVLVEKARTVVDPVSRGGYY